MAAQEKREGFLSSPSPSNAPLEIRWLRRPSEAQCIWMGKIDHGSISKLGTHKDALDMFYLRSKDWMDCRALYIEIYLQVQSNSDLQHLRPSQNSWLTNSKVHWTSRNSEKEIPSQPLRFHLRSCGSDNIHPQHPSNPPNPKSPDHTVPAPRSDDPKPEPQSVTHWVSFPWIFFCVLISESPSFIGIAKNMGEGVQ